MLVRLGGVTIRAIPLSGELELLEPEEHEFDIVSSIVLPLVVVVFFDFESVSISLISQPLFSFGLFVISEEGDEEQHLFPQPGQNCHELDSNTA